MTFDFTPDNRGIIAILDAQVYGVYRFVHDARLPYVRVGPSTDTEPVIIRAGAHLILLHGDMLELRGLQSTVDFAITNLMSDLVTLRQMPWKAAGLDALDTQQRRSGKPPTTRAIGHMRPMRFGSVQAQEQPEGGLVPEHVASRRPVKKPRHVIVQPEPSQPPVGSPPSTVPVPPVFQELCAREDVQPDLGDYLVIPLATGSASEPLPPWVVRSAEVDCIHVVQPRLQRDRPMHQEDSDGR